MRKIFLLSLLVLSTTFMWATPPTITIDGDKSDWAEIPMLSEPGTWPMLKVVPAADAELGTNALAYMMENKEDFDPTWAKYPTEFIDKDYNKSTEPISEYWAFSAMGVDYKATTGVDAGGWISFPKGMSDDNKVFEIGFPATYITDLGSKFGFAMYYNSGAWFCPDYSSPAVSPSNGFLYKTRAYTTLPATLTPENVYAHQSMGECTSYIDFGLRDNGNDTARWAAWPVELTKSGAYDVIANVTTTNGWKFEFWLVDVATNAIVAHMDAPTSDISSSKTSYNFGTMDLSSVPAGKYMLKVKNRTRYSKVKLESVVLDYLGGAVVNIPATLEPIDAMRSEYALINGDGEFRFTDDSHDGYVTSQWGKWNIHVTKGGSYNFTLNANSDNSHHYYLSVLNPDESLIEKFTLDGSSATPLTATTANLELAPGDYIVKIENFTSNSHGRVINIVANYLGGATIDIPATLMPEDAMLSTRAWVDYTGAVDSILFTPRGSEGHNPDEWAKWKINVAKAGNYKFTANVSSSNGQYYKISVLNSDESATIGEKDGTGTSLGSGDKSFATDAIELSVGEYIVKIANTYAHSKGRVLNIVATYEGGAVIDIPGQLLGEDAMLCKEDGGTLKMYHLANGDIKYNDNGYNLTEYALWNIHADAACELEVTLNIATAGHLFTVELYDGSTLLGSAVEADETKWDDGDIALADHLTIPAAGNYTIKLVNRQQYSGGALHGITFTEVIAPTFVTIDETATDNTAWVGNVGGAAVNVELTRSFTGGMYNTICLPFAVSSEKVVAAFGTGVELMYMTGATIDGSVLDLEFATTTSIYQGTPYLIKPAADVVNPQFTGVGFVLDNASATSGTNADFIGTFVKTTIPSDPNNLYLQANNMLQFSQSDVTIKGMRAYFHVKVPSSSPVVRPRIVLNGQVLTDIELVNGEPQTNGKFIENGQLIIIRDGIRYNAIGIRVK